jgi:MFS family permease
LSPVVSARSAVRRLVQTEAGAWGVMASIHNAFIQPLLISRGASQLALGLYISGSSLCSFGAGWLGPSAATRVGHIGRTTLIFLGFSRSLFLAFTAYLLFWSDASPALLIGMILLWALGEGLSGPLWTSFLAGMVPAGERARWVAMRAQAATIVSVPVLVVILFLVLFASREQALPIAYLVGGTGAVLSWLSLRRIFHSAAEQPVPPKRALTHLPQSPEARRFLAGVFMFWFASALTWPIVPRYITKDLDAPTAYFAMSQIVGAVVGIVMQPWWARRCDAVGPTRILLLSGIGSAIVPLLWAVAPVYWVGFGIDALAFSVWPGHMLGLTMRAIELVDDEADRPMMLGWTSLAQGAGAFVSPLISASLVGGLGVPVILVTAFALRFVSAGVMSGALRTQTREPVAASA